MHSYKVPVAASNYAFQLSCGNPRIGEESGWASLAYSVHWFHQVTGQPFQHLLTAYITFCLTRINRKQNYGIF